jgi:hypothetical protein
MTDAYNLATFGASPLHLPADQRGQITISCMYYGNPLGPADIADLCAAACVGWSFDGEWLRSPESMIIIHVPSFGIAQASQNALGFAALHDGSASVLVRRAKTPPSQQRRAADPPSGQQMELFHD